MHTLQAQVCGCISAHPVLPNQQTKPETKLKQVEIAVLKLGSKINQTSTITFQSFLVIFPWLHNVEKLLSLLGCATRTWV